MKIELLATRFTTFWLYYIAIKVLIMAKIKDTRTGQFVLDHGMRFTKEYRAYNILIDYLKVYRAQ